MDIREVSGMDPSWPSSNCRLGLYSCFSFQIGVEGVWDLFLFLFSGHGEFSPNSQACYSNPQLVRLFFWMEVRGKSHTRSLPFLQYLLLLSSASWSYPFKSVKKSVLMTEWIPLVSNSEVHCPFGKSISDLYSPLKRSNEFSHRC